MNEKICNFAYKIKGKMENKTAKKTAYFSILGNICLASIKIFSGILGNTYALIADGIESLGDTLSSILVLFGLKYSQKPADKNHPYGHGKIEPLITFIIVGILIFSSFFIAYQSFINIKTPHQLPESWTLIILGIIIIWKEISFQIVLKNSKLTHSTSLKADAWHHRADAITSIAAFIGISLALFLGEGYETADDWAALLASLIILFNAYSIFRPALREIMDEDNYTELTVKINTISKEVEGVIGIEKCYIRKVGMQYCIDIHLVVSGNISVKQGHDIAHKLKDILCKKIEVIHSIIIHIEPDYKDII